MWRNTGEDPTLHTDLMLRTLGGECREGIMLMVGVMKLKREAIALDKQHNMIQDHREKSTSYS